MKGLKIRKVKRSDLPELGRVYAQIYKKHDVGESWTAAKAQKMLGWYLKGAPDLAYLAEYKSKIVGGFLVIVKPWWDGNHLIEGEIFVHHNYQKLGIGSKLMKQVLKRAVEKYDAIVWEPFAYEWDYPFKWYKSLGFKKQDPSGPIGIAADPRELLKKLANKCQNES